MAGKFDGLVEALRHLGQEHQRREREDRTLLIKIHFEFYPISCEVLEQMFSGFGFLESIERFADGDQFHSRVCFQNQESAIEALNWLDGRWIFDGCCGMELFLVSTLGSHSSSNLGGVSEEVAAPNQRLVEDFVEMPRSSEETKNQEENHRVVEELRDQSKQGFDELREMVKGMMNKLQTLSASTSQGGGQGSSSDTSSTPNLDTPRVNGGAIPPGIANLEASKIDEQKKQRSDFTVVDEVQDCQEEIEISIEEPSQETEVSIVEGNGVPYSDTLSQETDEESNEIDISVHLLVNQLKAMESSKVMSDSLGIVVLEVESGKATEVCIVNALSGDVELEGLTDFSMNSFDCLRILSAHQVFEDMFRKDVQVLTRLAGGSSRDLMSENVADMTEMRKVVNSGVEFCVAEMIESNRVLSGILIFDPGGSIDSTGVWMVVDSSGVLLGLAKNSPDLRILSFTWVLRRLMIVQNFNSAVIVLGACIVVATNMILVFDPGGIYSGWILCSCVTIVCCYLGEKLCHKLISGLVFDLGDIASTKYNFLRALKYLSAGVWNSSIEQLVVESQDCKVVEVLVRVEE